MSKELLVTVLFYKQTIYPIFYKIGSFLTVLLLFSGAGTIFSETITYAAENKNKIHITSNKAVFDSEGRYAEFTGNVKAVQGDSTITSKMLTVYYKNNSNQENITPVKKQSIERILAKGEVKIKFGNRLAETEQAVYNADENVLILTGEKSIVKTGTNSITGKKITIYQKDGRIAAENGVNAVFHSDREFITE